MACAGLRSAFLAATLVALAAPSPGTGLTDGQLAGQRIVTAFRGATVTPSLGRRIRNGEIAGVILFGPNIRSVAQTRRLIADIQAVPRQPPLDAPLLVMVDQEGGRVRRLPGGPGPAARLRTVREGQAAGRAAAAALRRVGANVNLAPVADVARRGGFIAREERGAGERAEATARLVTSVFAGLRAGGVLAAAKHFPGLGSARVNTDASPTRLAPARSTLRRIDGVPFRALVDRGVPIVMVSSASYTAFPGGPALVNRSIVEGELRGRLGFEGVVMTDSLNARAIRAIGGPGPASVRAAIAGVDLILATSEPAASEVRRALLSGMLDGRVSRTTAAEAVARIARLRERLR